MIGPDANPQHDGCLQGGDDQRRDRFTDKDLPGCQRRHQQLVERALFALAGNGERGDDHDADGGDHGDQRRHHEPFVIEIRVIPVAHHQLAIVRFGFTFQQVLLIAFDDLLEIVRGNLRAVRVAPVQQKLERGGLVGVEVARKIRRETHDQQGFLFIDGGSYFLRAFQ